MAKDGNGQVGLVLSRRPNEQILIGDNIVVTVVEIRRGLVRLGVKAPLGVAVDRPEVRASKERTGAGMPKGGE